MEKVISYLEIRTKFDPKAIEEQFKTEVPILQGDEEVELAFKHGRVVFMVTNKRTLSIDIQTAGDKTIKFSWLPLKFVYGFSVQSAGTWSRTVKATMFSSLIVGGVTTEFGKSDTDIFAISNCLGKQIMNQTLYMAKK